MKKLVYAPQGTCSSLITIQVKDGIVKNIAFTDGCPGNTQGVASLAAGMRVSEVIRRLKGIKCADKPTSCPDQLARALESLEE
ncbi:MAG: TIGR03905 family TSCPD domain-containing protein [Elusimicrobia bacterium]|nr:TIGR03905 family TSCPD domain-containing protein [Elusimicrobiota bacterium]